MGGQGGEEVEEVKRRKRRRRRGEEERSDKKEVKQDGKSERREGEKPGSKSYEGRIRRREGELLVTHQGLETKKPTLPPSFLILPSLTNTNFLFPQEESDSSVNSLTERRGR